MREVRAITMALAVLFTCLLVLFSPRARAATGDITTAAGDGTPAVLHLPAGLSCDAAGNLYIADQKNNRIVRRDVVTGTLTTAVSGLTSPTGILVDKAGNIYIANTAANNVIKVDALTNAQSVIAGTGVAATSGDGGPAVSAAINSPCSLAMNIRGELYIAQRGGGSQDRVRKIDLSGNISTVAGGGASPVANGLPATAVAITFQLGGNYIGVDLSDRLYIADESQNFVYMVTSAGTITIIGGTGGNGFAGDGGSAAAALIDDPTSLAVDSVGNVFVSNDESIAAGDFYIRKIEAATGLISRVAGNGTKGFSGDGGPGALAAIDTLQDYGGACVDIFGNVYFSDFNNNRVRRLEGIAISTPPPGPTATFVARGVVGTAFSYTLPGTGPFAFTPAGGIPAGLALAGSAVTGTPTTAGTFAVNFTSGAASFIVYFAISANPLSVGNNGGGPLPIPRFTAAPTGGTSPVAVVFDPSGSYLPASGISNQRYLYQARWDYGDGVAELVPAAGPSLDPNAVLAPVIHTYASPALYTARFTIFVFIEIIDPATGNPVVPAQQFPGPNAFTEQPIRVADANYPPNPVVFNTGSQIGDGNIPFAAQITPSFGQDQDGFIVWAAIDWGDGTAALLPNPPSIPTIPFNHTYTTPGMYKVTISVIDNGRLPLGTLPPTVPAANDPFAALAYFKSFQAGLPLATFGPQFFNPVVNPAAPTALDAKFDPQLRQDFMFIQVPGNMTGLKGKFTLDLRGTGKDSLDETLQVNLPVASAADNTVTVTIGSGATALTKTFTTDRRGRFRDKSGFTFVFNSKKQTIRLRYKKAALQSVFGLANSTIVNGNVDLPILVSFGTTTTLAATVRFAYNSKQDSRGIGKGGFSINPGT